MRLLVTFVSAFFLGSLVSCTNKPETEQQDSSSESNSTPRFIQYHIVNEYPHNTDAFTEGLMFHNGFLYESTGLYGVSELRKIDLTSGKILQSHRMPAKYFGEGMTILQDKIYQLTYKEKTGFVYDLNTFKVLKIFTFSFGEGWGLTNDGQNLIASDGTNIIHFIDPHTFAEVKTLRITNDREALHNINELEFIKGYLYANVWQTDNIIKIDTATGKVIALSNLADLKRQTGIDYPSNGRTTDVLNGIAYDASGNRIFITGKYWPKVFEIKLDN